MGGSYTPFGAGFAGMQSPELETEEERMRRELAEAARGGGPSSLRTEMDRPPSFDDPAPDVSGRLGEVEEPRPTGSVTDDVVQRGLDVAGEGDDSYLSNYAEHLGNRPKREDYDVSTLRKILSVVGGTLAGGNPAVTNRLAGGGKYDDAMRDWQETGEGLGDVAGISQKQQASRNTLGGNVMSSGATDRGHSLTAETADEDRVVAEGNLGVREGELAEKVRAAPIAEGLEGRKVSAAEQAANTGTARAGSYDDNVQSLITSRANKPSSDYSAQLSPNQALDADFAAAQRAVEQNPAWSRFLDEDGMVQMDYELKNLDATDEAEYAKFIAAMKAIRDAEYPDNTMRRRIGEVGPIGGGAEQMDRDGR